MSKLDEIPGVAFRFPFCQDCDNRFDRLDKRGAAQPGFVVCPLCRAFHGRYEWAVTNNCNGIFESRPRLSDAEELVATDYAGIEARVVPVVTIEIPKDSIAAFLAWDEERKRQVPASKLDHE